MGLVIIVPPASADPDVCPPTCDRIPAAAWPDPRSIPLDSTYHWPPLAALAVPVAAARFRFEELCSTPPSIGDPRGYAVAARAQVAQPDGQWQMRSEILHWRGETWRGGQIAASVFDTAAAALRNCGLTAPRFVSLITTDEPNRIAAVINGPQTLHQYLIVDPANSTVSGIALWADPRGAATPVVPWPDVADGRVLDAMAAPLCTAYLGSCG